MTQKMEWRDDIIDTMVKLMKNGLSTTRIAEELSKVFKIYCSRNSVIGKIHRLGLATRKKPIESKPRPAGIPKQIRRRALIKTSKPLPPPRLVAIECVALHPVELLQIENNLCRWIICDPVSPASSTLMCGDPISPGSSWCPYHRMIGTVAPRARINGTARYHR